MNETIRRETYNQAKEWVLKAGEIIRDSLYEQRIIKSKEAKNDLVTDIDKMIELFFVKEIKRTYPKHLILSEEGYGDKEITDNGTVWAIDPIDGTRNFVNQKRNFAVSIAVIHQGVGEIGFVYDVVEEVLYSALKSGGAFKNDKRLHNLETKKRLKEASLSFNHDLLCESDEFDRNAMERLTNQVRSVRSKGSAALEIIQVAEGLSDGYIAKKLSPWDIAAATIILNEVNGTATRSDGNKINLFEEGTIFVSNKGIHKMIIQNYLKYWRRKLI